MGAPPHDQCGKMVAEAAGLLCMYVELVRLPRGQGGEPSMLLRALLLFEAAAKSSSVLQDGAFSSLPLGAETGRTAPMCSCFICRLNVCSLLRHLGGREGKRCEQSETSAILEIPHGSHAYLAAEGGTLLRSGEAERH
jgi:hypothetical protein